jgi:tetratricopeptide (TPR) repeat protein
LLLSFVIAAALAQPPSVSFERGRTAFERGEYSRAIEILRPLLYPEIRLDTEGKVVEAHRMLGVAHLFEKQNDLAAQEFRKLLQLRPDYRFDALLDPPQVVDFFNGVLREYEGELAQIEQRRKQADLEERQRREAYERAKNGPTVIERHLIRNSFTVNFIPFGAGQFQNGQRKKGWGFLVSESTLGAVSVGAFATNFAVYGFRPKTPCVQQKMGGPCLLDTTNQRRSELLTRVQLVSGGLFFAVAAWGIADAILNYQPEVPAPTEVRLSAPAHGRRLSLAPVLDAETLGAGLSFRF